jgi:hypothetical protein
MPKKIMIEADNPVFKPGDRVALTGGDRKTEKGWVSGINISGEDIVEVKLDSGAVITAWNAHARKIKN